MIRQTKQGHWIIHEDSHIGKWVEESGRLDHDQNTLPVLYRYIRPGDVVMDVGANIGDHTIAYSDWVGSEGEVLAVECGPEALECLIRNTEKRLNVQVIPHALWSTEKALGFTRSNNIGASFVTEGTEIKAYAIDQMKIPRLDFIKIDAEGCEENILIGGEETIERLRPILCLEVNDGALKRNGSSSEKLLNYIKSRGYSWRPLHEFHNDPNQFDIIARHKA